MTKELEKRIRFNMVELIGRGIIINNEYQTFEPSTLDRIIRQWEEMKINGYDDVYRCININLPEEI